MKYFALGLVVTVLVVAIVIALNLISWSNQEVALRQTVLAQQKVNATIFDKTWKVISQQAQVTDNYKESFKDVYKTIMNERYENSKNVMFNWITENNPNFSSGLFEKLMVSIESLRAEFAMEQKKLIDLGRQHTTMIQQFPGNFIAGFLGREAIDLQIVTSEKTEDAFKTGQENDVKVF